MSLEHDLAIENSEELVLKPDARPTISYDDDEHYLQYVDAMYGRSQRVNHRLSQTYLDHIFGRVPIIERKLRRHTNPAQRY
jgi:hypothetical protein